MWEISIWYFAFLFAINGFLVYSESSFSAIGYHEISPFTNSTITLPAQPNINGTIAAITATSATNSTGGPLISLWQTANYAWNGSIFLVQFLYGSITGSFFLALGMPAAFLAIIYGTEILFFGITVIHILRSGNLL